MSKSKPAIGLVSLTLFLVISSPGNGGDQTSSSPEGVPRLVKFSSYIKDLKRTSPPQPLSITFSIYAEPVGGDPLWTETQAVTAAADGRFEVLLGAATPGGLPASLFAVQPAGSPGASDTQSRWLGIQINSEPEQEPRTMLVSVPYALKAADADKLGGRPASDFVLADQLKGATGLNQLGVTSTTAPAKSSPKTSPAPLQTKNLTAQPGLAAAGLGLASLNSLAGTSGQFTYTFVDGKADLPSDLNVDSIYINRVAPFHITEVLCEINAGAASINLQKNGLNILGTSLPCSPAGGLSYNFVSGTNLINYGDKIGHVTTSLTSGVKRMTVVVKYVVD
ncbi:MAG TPA: hypothetical protein VFD30_06075 [Terriglobia bacterium]|nr:hypothetical protein [Terriglobia bacterium]